MGKIWCHHESVPNWKSELWERPIVPYLQQTALAGSLTTAQRLDSWPMSLFQTIKCTSGLLLFGWPGDKVFELVLFS